MQRSLRLLAPNHQLIKHRQGGLTTLFWWAVFVILSQFFLSTVVIQALGLDSIAGGTIVKFHPASYLVVIWATVALFGGTVPFRRRCRETPGLMAYVLGIPVLGLYSTYWTGISGSAIFVESFLTAGLLALMLESATAKQKRLLGRILITVCVFNVIVALYESVSHVNWFPLIIDPDLPVADAANDFRANAFYGHPLTGSLITTMAIFLLYEMRMRLRFAAPIFVLLFIGLLSFGGRTALGVTIVVSALAAGYVLIAGLVQRKLRLDFVLAIVGAAIVLPLLITFIVTQTTIAERIMDTLYYDDSAEVRTTQWLALNYLDLRGWLFGITKDQLAIIVYNIGFDGKIVGIENFWLLMFLQLGGIGFLVFVGILVGFLIHLARYAGTMNGWLLMIAAIIIDSSSNSLGVKSNDLFLEIGFLIAISGFRNYVPVRTTPLRAGRRDIRDQSVRKRDSPERPERSLRALSTAPSSIS